MKTIVKNIAIAAAGVLVADYVRQFLNGGSSNA